MRPLFRKGQDRPFILPRALQESQRLLCIDAGDLSEFLFHMPLVNAIRQQHPGCRIDFLLPEKHEALVVPSGLAKLYRVYREGQVNPWRPAFGNLLRELGSGQYDVAMVMSQEPQARLELAALATGARLRLGPSHEKSWPAINFELRPPRNPDIYLGDRLTAAAPFLGLSPKHLNPRWPLPMDRMRHMAQQVHFHKPNPDQMLVGMDPGLGKSGHAVALENLQYLAGQLSRHLLCRVLPLAQAEDKERRTQFEVRLPDVPAGLPRDNLLDQVLLLAQCDLFVGGNTDFFHFAVALGVPAVGLFTPSDAPCWVPTGRKRAKVLTVKKGQKVEMETLLAAIGEVTEGRARTATTIMAADRDGEAPEMASKKTAGSPDLSPPETS